MAGKVIQTLRSSPLASLLSEAELRLLANCGRLVTFSPEQMILDGTGQDERLFVLRQGDVSLRLAMWSEGGLCGGDTTFNLEKAGDIFGWATWVRPDRITLEAQALDTVSLVALDLDRLGDSQVFFKVSQSMLQSLYARLQESGICPPNIQGLLRIKQLFPI
jgi:CRP-like cAMP-binding protein